MGSNVDRLVGLAMVAASAVIFIYYTIWVIVLPFVDSEHAVRSYFLQPYYAIAIPVGLCAVAGFGIGAFLVYVLVFQNMKKTKTT